MSVRIDAAAIHLAGRCLVEDAEALLVALQAHPDLAVQVSEVQRLHMAVAQVLFAAARPIRGTPANSFVAHHLLNSRNDGMV